MLRLYATLLVCLVPVLRASPTPQGQCSSGNKTRPTPTDYTPAKYEESADVTTLSGYTSDFCLQWFTDQTACEEYAKEFIIFVAMPIIIGSLILLIFPFYLCCHGPCAKCTENLGDMKSRIVLVCIYGVVFVVGYICFAGRANFVEGANTIVELITSVEDSMSTVQTEASNLINASRRANATGVSILGGVCDYRLLPDSDPAAAEANPQIANANTEIRNLGTTMTDMGEQGLGPATDLYNAFPPPDDVTALKANVEGNSEQMVTYAIGFVVALTTVTCAVGLVGVVCCHQLFFPLFYIAAWITILVIMIFLAILIPLNVGFADFCHPGPRDNLGALALSAIPADDVSAKLAAETLDYFLACTGDNPIDQATKAIFITLNGMQNAICELTDKMDGEYSINTANGTLSVAKMDAAACNAAVTSAGDALTGFISAAENSVRVAIDCATFNEPLVLLLDEAICHNVTSGIYSLWSTQVAAAVFLAIGMFFAPCVWTEMSKSSRNSRGGSKESVPL